MKMMDNALAMSNSTCLPVLTFSSENKFEMLMLTFILEVIYNCLEDVQKPYMLYELIFG
ncbi:MAG: hypothetical protein Q4Q18_06435 [Methanobrevibacter sp.]|nr:hypothetical protein [Methanobrevibacter sp.]